MPVLQSSDLLVPELFHHRYYLSESWREGGRWTLRVIPDHQSSSTREDERVNILYQKLQIPESPHQHVSSTSVVGWARQCRWWHPCPRCRRIWLSAEHQNLPLGNAVIIGIHVWVRENDTRHHQDDRSVLDVWLPKSVERQWAEHRLNEFTLKSGTYREISS